MLCVFFPCRKTCSSFTYSRTHILTHNSIFFSTMRILKVISTWTTWILKVVYFSVTRFIEKLILGQNLPSFWFIFRDFHSSVISKKNQYFTKTELSCVNEHFPTLHITMGISASKKRINKKKRYANKCHHCIKFSPRKIYNFD